MFGYLCQWIVSGLIRDALSNHRRQAAYSSLKQDTISFSTVSCLLSDKRVTFAQACYRCSHYACAYM